MPCAPSTSAYSGILPATSTSRPTGLDLYVGRYIYETDTGRTMMYDGTGWVIMDEPDQSWSNPFTGITDAGQSFAGGYRRSGGWLAFEGRLSLSAGISAVSAAGFTLPVAAARQIYPHFSCVYIDAGSNSYPGHVQNNGTTAGTLYAINVAGTYASRTAISTTVPFTFGASDTIDISGYYAMTTRYS